MGVDQLHGHRSFADGGGAALGRARADVTSREGARDGGLEEVVGTRRGTGQDEALLVAGDDVVEPLGAGACAEEQEQESEWQALAGLERDRLELAVGAV